MKSKFAGVRGLTGIGLMVFLSLTLAWGTVCYGADSQAQIMPSGSGNPNQEAATGQHGFKYTTANSQKLDAAQTFPATPAVTPGKPASGSDVGGLAPSKPAVSVPLSLRLANLSQVDRANAAIQVEADSQCSAADLSQLKQAEALWSQGSFEAALDSFRSLEAAGVHFALGIAWKHPQPASATLGAFSPAPAASGVASQSGPFRPSSNVRIGARTNITKSVLDFAASNGNLFAVLKWSDASGSTWTVYLSTNGGRSWQETASWWTSYPMKDIGAAVVDNFLYIGYLGGDSASYEARLRRCLVSDGSLDSAFGYQTVFNKGTAINEVCLAANADAYNNRLYYSAILSGGQLIYYWGRDVNTASLVWTEVSSGVTNAGSGLAMTWNQNYPSGYYLFASYIAGDGTKPVMVLRLLSPSDTWDSPIQVLSQYTGSSGSTSISAYNDAVICAFEQSLNGYVGPQYEISYDGGNNWNNSGFSWPAGHDYYLPAVTARGGQGTAMVFSEEAGDFDPVWFISRAGYHPGLWTDPLQINQIDCQTGLMNSIQWLPGAGNPYGAIYIGGDLNAYFDRISQFSGAPGPMLLLLMN